MTDPRKLRPGELCRLLNSTPLGEVIKPSQLRRHRTQAGLHIGNDRHVDLLRYTAWQVHLRHKTNPDRAPKAFTDLTEAAQGAAAFGTRWNQVGGHGQKFTSKQESLIAALLTEPNHAAAAIKAGVGKTTLYRWLQLPEFRAAYRLARRGLVEEAIGRVGFLFQQITGILERALPALGKGFIGIPFFIGNLSINLCHSAGIADVGRLCQGPQEMLLP